MKTPRAKAAKPASSEKKSTRRAPSRTAKAKSTPAPPTARKSPARAPKSAQPPQPEATHEPAEGEAVTTTNLEEIKAWVEQRGGKPVSVKGTAPEHEAGLLRIDFPGYSGEGTLEPISWEEWYAKFEEKNLAFLYQDKTKDGKESRFFKLVSRK